MTDQPPGGATLPAVPTFRILLLEDDGKDADLVRAWLARALATHFELDCVADPEAGRAALADNRHNVCLFGQRLRPGDGPGLAREARRLGWTGPIILLTGRGDRDLNPEAVRAGADDHLVKDEITPALLERAIRYALERRRKDEALSVLGHRLRDPLAVLRNALGVIRLSGDPAERESTLALADRQVVLMAGMADQLLDVLRLGPSGKDEG
jgi:DNA-binding response OmpR family regulator